MIAFNGVRSSCDSVARNSSFSLFEELRAFLLGAPALDHFVAQLVVGGGQLLLPQLDPLEHAVECVHQHAKFVLGRPLCSEGVIAARGHLPRRVRQRHDGLRHQPLEPGREQQRDAEADEQHEHHDDVHDRSGACTHHVQDADGKRTGHRNSRQGQPESCAW